MSPSLIEWSREVHREETWQGDLCPTQLPDHVGLWLDRMLDTAYEPKNAGWPARTRLFKTAIAALTPTATASGEPAAVSTYRAIFGRWLCTFENQEPGLYRRLVRIEALNRIILHRAGGESTTDGTLLMHHTYGVPYVPGSALKGLARARLCSCPDGGEARARVLLGFLPETAAERALGKGHASHIEFLDALWIPEPSGPGTAGSALALDAVTNHHSDYYTREQNRPLPLESDSPIPVESLTVSPKTRFLVIVECAADLQPHADWLVDRVLLPALAEQGLGAATGASYGRMKSLEPPPVTAPQTAPSSWELCRVEHDRGRSVLHAVTASGGRRAQAGKAATAELLESLSEELRERLVKRKKEIQLDAKLVQVDGAWRIAAIRSPGEAEDKKGRS